MSANAPWYSYHQGWRATWECNFNTGKTIRASSNWTFFLWFIIMMRICVSPSIYVNTIHSFFRLRLCARMANALLCLNIHFFFFRSLSERKRNTHNRRAFGLENLWILVCARALTANRLQTVARRHINSSFFSKMEMSEKDRKPGTHTHEKRLALQSTRSTTLRNSK